MRQVLCYNVYGALPPPTTMLGIRSFFLFQNVILGVLESFYQLNHLVDISLYLTKTIALRTLGRGNYHR